MNAHIDVCKSGNCFLKEIWIKALSTTSYSELSVKFIWNFVHDSFYSHLGYCCIQPYSSTTVCIRVWFSLSALQRVRVPSSPPAVPPFRGLGVWFSHPAIPPSRGIGQPYASAYLRIACWFDHVKCVASKNPRFAATFLTKLQPQSKPWGRLLPSCRSLTWTYPDG